MAGTVRGTFDLNSRPASSALRRLNTQGRAVDRTMASVGRSMDRIGTPRQVEQLRRYERRLASIERQGKRTFRLLRREWRATDRQVVRSVAIQSKAIDHLQTKLIELGAMKVSPEIDLDGFAVALGQAELLHTRLKALSRERVTPRVGVAGTAVRAAATRAGGGGGGGFGGGQGLIRSMNIGPLNLGRKGFPFLAAAGLPAAVNLGGAAVGLSGSLGAGALGAGALGIAGGGILTTAIGSIASVAIPTAGRLREASDALKDFQEEVLQSGRNSVEAREAWRKFNMVVGQAPRGTRRFLKLRERVGRRYGALTRPAQQSLMGVITDPFEAADALTPQFAGISNRFFGKAEGASDRFFGRFATGGRSRRFLGAAGEEAAMSVDEMEAITENVLGSLMNITVASRPFFRQALNFLEEWTGGWLDSTDNVGRTRDTIRDMVGHLKAWLKLGGATFRLLKDILSAGAGPGRGLVFDLTDQLNEWDRWVRRNPREVRSFFRDTVDSTKRLAGALGAVADSLFKISKLLTPLLDQFSGLVSFAGDAGLLSPGGLPFLIGAGAGIRNARRGASARILGGGRGGAAATGGASGFGGGVLAGAALGGRGGGFRRGRVGGPHPKLSTPYGAMYDPRHMGRGVDMAHRGVRRLGSFGRGFAARFGPLMALSAGLSGLSYQGNLAERTQFAASNATFGLIPAPKTADESFQEGWRNAMIAQRRLIRGQTLDDGTRVPGVGRGARGLRTQAQALTGGIRQFRGSSDPSRRGAIGFDRAQLEEVRNQLSELGYQASGDFYRAFTIRSRDRGAEAALRATISPTLAKLRELGPLGGRVFAQNTLRWAREAARRNPELKDEYGELTRSIEQRFRRMGRTIEIINGRIYTDSQGSWRKIRNVVSTEAWAAEREARGAFGALERDVFRSLRGFGFSQGEAKTLMNSLSQGGASRKGAMYAIQNPGSRDIRGPPNPRTGSPGPGYARGGRRFAGGGRFGGMGRGDTVGLPGGGTAAPGEFWIGNRHTERRLDSFLAPYGTSVSREIEGERMRHSSAPLKGRAFGASLGRRFASGGISAAGRLATQMGMGASGGPGFGGIPSSGHAAGSLHYQGLAYDVTGSAAQMRRYFFAALRSFRGSINELFYDPIGWYLDNGQRVAGAIGDHADHVHIGFMGGGARGAGRFGKAGGTGRMGGVNLPRRRSRLGGVPGAVSQAAMDAVRGGAQQSVNRKLGRMGGGLGGFRGGGGTPQANMALARRMMMASGFPPSEWSAFRELGMRESGWRVNADNPTSDAYGIPQALPGSKMASAGADWRSNPATQIRWMLGYIRGRYRTPSGALSFHDSHNWYARGGRRRWGGSFRQGGDFLTRPGRSVLFEAGEGLDQEEVSVRPRRRPGAVGGKQTGGGGGSRTVEAHVHFHGPVHVRSDRDLKAIEERVGAGLLEALRQTDGVAEKEVIGS